MASIVTALAVPRKMGNSLKNQRINIILFFLILFNLNLGAATLTQYEANKIADAIKREENSTNYPYGIHYKNIRSESGCRQICVNTINANYMRWQHQNTNTDYLEFLGAKYCPVNHVSWSRNVKRILGPDLCAQINKKPLTK